MTKKEKIIVSAYTGYLMCDFSDIHTYMEEKLGRPVYTSEMAKDSFWSELRAAIKDDFVELCKPKKTYIPLKKCSCGAKRSVRMLYSVYGDRYKCIKCGLEGDPTNNLKQARLNWNKAVEESEARIKESVFGES